MPSPCPLYIFPSPHVCVLQSNEAPKGRMRPVPANQRGNLMLNDLHIHLSRLQDDLIYIFFSMRLANRELITVH